MNVKSNSIDQLKRFLKEIYHRNEDGFYSCNYCAIFQKGSSHIMEHAQIHVESLEFDCDGCGNIFKKTDSLRAHKNYKCVQRQLNSQDGGPSDEYKDEDEVTKGIKKGKVWEIKNIVDQTIASMETSKKTWKRLSFSQNVIEPLLKAGIIRFNGSSTKYLADRYQKKIKKDERGD